MRNGEETKEELFENELNVHLLLHELFHIDVNIARKHHESQIELYIKFDSCKLLAFLRKTESYDHQRAAEFCGKRGKFKE